LRDNNGAESAITRNWDVKAYSKLKVSFSYLTRYYQAGDKFVLEKSDNVSNSLGPWVLLRSWSGQETLHEMRSNASVVFNVTANKRLQLRLMSIGASDTQTVYIDDICISPVYV